MMLTYTLKTLLPAISVSALLALPTPALAEQGSASGCQYIRDKVYFYTGLRQSGGTSAQIVTWSAAQHKYRTLFKHYQCDIHAKELK